MREVKAWSKSGLGKLLDGCGWQYYLNKIVGMDEPDTPATVVGVQFHAGIEQHERARILWHRTAGQQGSEGGIPLERAEAVVEQRIRTAAVTIPDAEMGKHRVTVDDLVYQGVTATRHWYLSPVPEGQPGAGASPRDRVMGWRPLGAEPYVRTHLPTVTHRPIHGFIDVVYLEPDGGLVVVDDKTANGWSRWPTTGAGHELEAAVYVEAARLSPGIPFRTRPRMEFHVMRKTAGKRSNFEGVRIVPVEVRDLDVQYLHDSLIRADRIVETEAYRKNTGWNLCSAKWCAFYEGCEVTGSLAPGGDGLTRDGAA